MRSSLFTSNSKKLIRITKVFVFVFMLAIVLDFAAKALSIKASDGIAQWDMYYEMEDDTLDVLVIGSSHAYVNINPVVMYESEGIAAFNLGASMQNMWNSYYFFKESLKYQKPELLILEGYGTCYVDDYTDYGKDSDSTPRIIKNNFGLRWSLLRVQSVIDSAPEGKTGDFLIEFMQTHDRYESLSQGDFYDFAKYPEGETWRGQADNYSIEEQTEPLEEILNETGIKDMAPKTEEYYRKILELAEKEGIQVCVVLTPYPSVKTNDKKIFNRAKEIADEYGADFEDFNTQYHYTEIGLDFSKDYADRVHLNYMGNEKFSVYLASYLDSKYNLTDRRDDDNYSDWENEVRVRNTKILNQDLNNTHNLSAYKDLLNNNELSDNYIYLYNYVSDGNVVEAAICSNDEVIYSSKTEEAPFYYYPDKWNTLFVDESMNPNINSETCSITINGYNIVVYDTLNSAIVDKFGINTEYDGNISEYLVR